MSHTVLESAKEYPPNDIFYQELHGFINMSFTGVPLFISKNHFLDADPAWENMVDIRSENGYKQLSNPWDDTYLIVEPNTGASFTAVVYLQTNVLTSQDILFVREPIMIPVFSLYRSGNITESSAKDLFGDLQFALAAKRKLLLIGLFGLALTAMLTLVYLHKIRVKMDTTKKESLL